MMACVHKEEWGKQEKNIFIFACSYIKKTNPENTPTHPKRK